jgi:endonuclease III-like uncharacterized protein
MSSQQSVKNILMETESDIGIFGIMIKLVQTKFQKGVTKFSKSQIQRALINIVMNLSCDPKEAEQLMQNPLFKKVVKIGFETLDIGLLKIINNVTYFCPPEMTMKLAETVVSIREILKAQFAESNKNFPVIQELIGILSNCCLGEKYDNFLDKQTLDIIKSLVICESEYISL